MVRKEYSKKIPMHLNCVLNACLVGREGCRSLAACCPLRHDVAFLVCAGQSDKELPTEVELDNISGLGVQDGSKHLPRRHYLELI